MLRLSCRLQRGDLQALCWWLLDSSIYVWPEWLVSRCMGPVTHPVVSWFSLACLSPDLFEAAEEVNFYIQVIIFSLRSKFMLKIC